MEQERKKIALIRILQILEKHSDVEHPLTQKDIGDYLENEYSITIDRKAISRNVATLKEAGYEIESTKKGTYLAVRDFEDSELHLLIDGVLSSKYIASNHTMDIIDRLCNLSSEYFKSHINNIKSVKNWSKTDNKATFLNIEAVDNAIESKKQITFEYNQYGVDKKLHKTYDHQVTPIQLILSNQRYYLMAYNTKKKDVTYYRVDHITNMKIIKEKALRIDNIHGIKNEDFFASITNSPYLFSDKPVKVEFIAKKNIVDQIIDWFGKDVYLKEDTENTIKVEVHVSAMAMEYWALQYLDYVEIIKPESLRDKIKNKLMLAIDKYK